MIKNIRKEFKAIKWTKPSDVAKQTVFVAVCVVIGAVSLGLFDAGVQALIGLFI